MCAQKPTSADIQKTITQLREAAKILNSEGRLDKASEFMKKAARLENAASKPK